MKIMVAFLGSKKKQQHKKDTFLHNKIEKKKREEFYRIKSQKSEKRNKNKSESRQDLFDVLSNFPKKKAYQRRGARKIERDYKRRSAFEDTNRILRSTNQEIVASKLIFLTIMIIPIFVFLLSHSKHGGKLVLGSVSNFRQASEEEVKIVDLLATYGLYNSNNYRIKPSEEEEKVQMAQKEKISTDEEIIDELANIEDIATFFGDKNTQVQITENSSNIQRINVGTSKILNYSSKRNIDFERLLNENITLTKKSDKILLYNTHTSESYTNSEEYQFEYTGTMRTTDANYNMLSIAKRLNENLLEKGFQSVQNTTPHDYGTYTSAYAKSRITVQEAISSMQGAGLIIDVHRDASANLSFAPTVNIKGVEVAQLMFVVGVGSNSVPNENWEDNLKLALQLQQIADKVYPGLFRPMFIRNSVYNQDLNKYSLLIEFGATGNTIEQVKRSTRCLANLLNIMYKD